MTSPGVKRPLEQETVTQISDLDAGEIHDADATGGDANTVKIEAIKDSSSSPNINDINNPSNGNKRRCTTNNSIHLTNNNLPQLNTIASTTTTSTVATANDTTIRTTTEQNNDSFMNNSSFREPSSMLGSLSDNITLLIDDELKQANENHSLNHSNNNNESSNHNVSQEPPILTARQTQAICEKLIREREQRLRDEYDRILARKLAEQYDVFAKANYLNSFVESAQRNMSTTTTPSMTSPPTPTASASPSPSMNAFAAALHMQRSVAAAAAAANPQPVTTASTNSISDLNQFAASLTATNGHTSAIPTPQPPVSHHHHHNPLPYNSFQQQAAAAAAAAAAMQHQAAAAAAAAHHRGHHHLQSQQQAQQQAPSTQQQNQHRGMTPINMGQANAVGLAAAAAASTFPSGPVLLTSNLDEKLATPEALFTLFGVFGDVVRVKILFNKKDNALIQMADATRAQVAQSYLDKQRIFGKIIRVTRSKHQLVQMPREGNQFDAGLTKDFTNSPLHRFKIPGSRNYLNIYPPSNTLHISNIPGTVDEADLHKAFKEQCGFEFIGFKFFPKDRKMALMRFASTEHATIALIKMHNFQITEENNLRVSFSKTLI